MIQLTVLGIQFASSTTEYLLLHPHATELVLPIPITTPEAQNIAALLYTPTKEPDAPKRIRDIQSAVLPQSNQNFKNMQSLSVEQKLSSAPLPLRIDTNQQQENLTTLGLLLAETKKNSATDFSPLATPHPYGFISTLLTSLNAQVTAVHITHVLHNTYQAQALINQAGTLEKISCSLVEAVCLALQCKANIYCFKNLLQYGKNLAETLDNLPRTMRFFAEQQIELFQSKLSPFQEFSTPATQHPQVQIKFIQVNTSKGSAQKISSPGAFQKDITPTNSPLNTPKITVTVTPLDVPKNTLPRIYAHSYPNSSAKIQKKETTVETRIKGAPSSLIKKKQLNKTTPFLTSEYHTPFFNSSQVQASILETLNISPSAIPSFSLSPAIQSLPIQDESSKEAKLYALLQVLLPESDDPM